jgi:hypothetical protein
MCAIEYSIVSLLRRPGMCSYQKVRIAMLGFLFLVSTFAWASITGSISGVVTDASGAVVAGAQVVAIDTQTGVKTTVTTDAKGF